MTDNADDAVTLVPDRFKLRGAFGFWQIATAEPQRIAVIAPDGSKTLAGDLLARSNRVAHLLRARGLVPGDTVSILYPNHPDYIAIALAAQQTGLHLVPVNWHLTTPEISYLVANSDSRALFAHERFADVAAAAAAEAGFDGGAKGDTLFGSCAFGAFRALDEALAAVPDTLPSHRCMGGPMFYTSGTTGRPKGVVRPVRAAIAPEQVLATALPWHMDLFGLQAGDGVHLTVAPLYHAAPHMRATQTLHLGHTVVLTDKWHPEEMLKAIEHHGITSTQMAPIMFHRLLQLPQAVRQRYRVDTLSTVIHAGAPCPVNVKRQMIAWWGPVLYEFYAATEGGGTSVRSADWLANPGTVGRAYPTSQVSVLDEDGRELPPGEVGMIYMQDGAPFAYYKDPAKTEAARRGGRFTAGDYGYLDADGWLYICDRRVDLILSGGVNIYPAEIEAVLLEHPQVFDAAVIGLPDEEWGQRVHAIVQPVAGVDGDAALTRSITDWCAGKLAKFKQPRTVDYAELPRTDAGKIGRGKLREEYLRRLSTTHAAA